MFSDKPRPYSLILKFRSSACIGITFHDASLIELRDFDENLSIDIRVLKGPMKVFQYILVDFSYAVTQSLCRTTRSKNSIVIIWNEKLRLKYLPRQV